MFKNHQLIWIKKKFEKLINENFNEIFSELKKYYNSDIFVTNVELKKNLSHKRGRPK